ncbi:RidA family protein [Lelliottia amnigena]|uniref:RidA family protein n=1 Tax=Lelliottia amnigena TaxID=61646 RepID=A0AAP2ABV5_LELAM|nr:RidA family protein [Lelliottia amnigena]MBL5898520.1 RidA family protein [Lelliottia amnigena]MBL5933671.1 RidA family protein [Lelliottia amnigena]
MTDTLNTPGGNYVPVMIHEGLAYVSGQLPRRGETLLYTGKVGAEVDLASAQAAAAFCADLCLDAVSQAVGGDAHIVQVVKVVGYIASAPGFTQQSQVMNGASDRLVERLGSRGQHARTSVGVAELPRGAPIELEMVVAVRQ